MYGWFAVLKDGWGERLDFIRLCGSLWDLEGKSDIDTRPTDLAAPHLLVYGSPYSRADGRAVSTLYGSLSVVERKMKRTISLFGMLALVGSLWFPLACRAQIPGSFFGMHLNQEARFPLQVGYGSFRDWDSNQSSWQNLATCVGHTNAECQANPSLVTYTWTHLDQNLSNLYSAGITDGVLYTLSRTPVWASSNPTGTGCSYGNGTCYPPADMNADGSCSGANSTCAIWDNWVTSIASHVNNANYRRSHAHIQLWEAQNEIECDVTLTPNACGGIGGTTATWAELLRLNEDLRCILEGVGTIHNYPTAGNSASCASYLTTLGQPAIDSTALVSVDSNSPSTFWAPRITQNYLYCNHNPSKDLGTSTSCTWSGGLNWGSSSVDIINFHFYVTNEQPENDLPAGSSNNWVTSIEAWLSASDQAKPLINGEGSCGNANVGGHIWNDSYSMAAFVPRYLALLWSAGISRSFYYSYDGMCSLWNSGGLTPAGIALNSTYSWLLGSTPVNTPFCSNTGTVWTCALIEANGKPAQLVWDSQYGPGGTTAPANCSTASVPTICGNTPYTVPTPYSADWVDSAGTSHAYSATVTIGAAPILLEGKLPDGGIKLTGTVSLSGNVSLRTQ